MYTLLRQLACPSLLLLACLAGFLTANEADANNEAVNRLVKKYPRHADVVTHVDPVTILGEECNRIKKIILDILNNMNMTETIQDFRVVKNHGIESILFQIPVSVEFSKNEQFRTLCERELHQMYPDCKVMIEFKNQMSMG